MTSHDPERSRTTTRRELLGLSAAWIAMAAARPPARPVPDPPTPRSARRGRLPGASLRLRGLVRDEHARRARRGSLGVRHRRLHGPLVARSAPLERRQPRVPRPRPASSRPLRRPASGQRGVGLRHRRSQRRADSSSTVSPRAATTRAISPSTRPGGSSSRPTTWRAPSRSCPSTPTARSARPPTSWPRQGSWARTARSSPARIRTSARSIRAAGLSWFLTRGSIGSSSSRSTAPRAGSCRRIRRSRRPDPGPARVTSPSIPGCRTRGSSTNWTRR